MRPNFNRLASAANCLHGITMLLDPTVDRPDAPAPSTTRPLFVGSFESTYLPGHGVDVSEVSRHSENWRADLDAVLGAGVATLRYPLRWHRIEPEPGRFDWSATDEVMEYLRERGANPIVDLVHHTSYPEWLSDGFRDRRFGPAYLRYAEAVATRYPWLSAYSLFNEPFATLFLAGHEALWPPYDRGVTGFLRLAQNVLPAVSSASTIFSELLPSAEHVWVDTAERHAGAPGESADYAALANDRRHILLDLALGHDLDPKRPFVAELLKAGGEQLFDLPPVRVDVLGLDYYCHSEWWYDETGAHSPSPHPIGFAEIAGQYGQRYGLPMMLTETNIRGLPSDRVSWLRYMLEQYETAVGRGVALRGFCWFPYVDSTDWDSLLARPAGRVDPVGVVTLGAEMVRERTVFTSAWEAAAGGAPVSELPAYRFQSPCDAQLAGLMPQMAHWPWEEPPVEEIVPVSSAADVPPVLERTPAMTSDLIVLSHLRWTFVWQRPQHLVSRFAAAGAQSGRRTWFVEEPVAEAISSPVIRSEQHGGVTRVWLAVPEQSGPTHGESFAVRGAEDYGRLLAEFLASEGVTVDPTVLLYTPMAYDLAVALHPGRLCYDVMDDLASFRAAPHNLRLRQRELLRNADVVFAGGRTLHRSISQQRESRSYLFPSGVDSDHYATSRELRPERESGRRKVAGFVGVIDERLDLDLLAGVAAELPDWTVRIVGPVVKIDPATLPQAPNIEYPGMAAYDDLPRIMADFDVALMPFALNEATRSISPTKTLEYLAAGLPVVSTRVADVVTDYAGVVHFADDARAFGEACLIVLDDETADRDSRAQVIQKRHSWDSIADAMWKLIHPEPGTPAAGNDSAAASVLPTSTTLASADRFSADLELAHHQGAGAAMAGLADPGLGDMRLSGPNVAHLAHAAVSSATPFLRAPLLARASAALLLHPVAGDEHGACPTCGTAAPCATAVALKQ